MPAGIIVYNPTAGRFPSRLLAERACNVLRENGWEVHLERSVDSDHITQLARKAADDKLDAFFMAGGDGSLNRAIAGLVGSETALGVLPAGTSNVFAQELGLPVLSWTRWMALEESARQLVKSKVCPVDVGLCNDYPFLLWVGLGLDAFIVRRIEPRQRWEKHFSVVHYATSVVWHASFWHGLNLDVVVDGETVSGHFLLALVSNVNLYAGGLFQLSPAAKLDDGLMDLWLFEGETLGDTVQMALDLFTGRHVQSDSVQLFPFKELSLRSDSPLYMQMDGEPMIADSPAQISVLPKSLLVLVPEEGQNDRIGGVNP